LLKDLAEYADINVRHHKNGTVDVYIGSDPLVQFDRSRGLTVEVRIEDGFERTAVVFEDNRGPATFRDGKLAGIVNTRDDHVVPQIEQLDELARGLIFEVNKIHAQGKGLEGRTHATSTFGVSDTTAVLNSAAANLEYPPQNGVFIVNVRDTISGEVQTTQIEVDLDGLNGDDTTLDSLAASLNGVTNLNASVTADNRLQLDSDTDYEFWFSEDSSNALGALGVNAFFTGTNAADIAVHADLKSNPKLIAASLNGEKGDGGNAGMLSKLADAAVESLNSNTMLEFQARMVNTLAVNTAAANTAHEASAAVYGSLTAQREAISGVSLDEEALDLTVYQRAFQGASRYLGVVEQLSDELLNLVR
jgi:flagellar hook-associated protein 1 FlgK